MPSIRIELYKGKKLKNDYYPVCVVVTNNGKVKRKTVERATEDQWDAEKLKIRSKGREDYKRANIDIQNAFDKCYERYKELKDSGREWESEEVFKEKQSTDLKTFKTISLSYLDTIDNGATFITERSYYRKFMKFTDDADFYIEDVNELWISRFKAFCKTKNLRAGKGNGDNSISYFIRYLKRVANIAGVENKVLKKTKAPIKEPLLSYPDLSDLKNIQTLELKDKNLINVRNIIMLQIYFRGMRIGDALQLKWEHIHGSRLIYTTGKRGHDHDLEISKPAMDILNQYRDSGTVYIFPYLSWTYNKDLSLRENNIKKTQVIKNAESLVNHHFKTIAKLSGYKGKISPHTTRHLFAIWADDVLKGDLAMVQRLLGHKTRAMTERYIKRLRHTTDLDEAALAVLSGIG